MAASSSIMMASAMGAQGVSSFGSAYSQSQAISAQGDYRKRVAETNADLAEVQSKDAIDRGNRAAARNDMAKARMIGTQRAGFASQGVDVNSGSALDVQKDTAELGALDSLTIRNNAWREAWGYQVKGLNASYEGKFAGMAADFDSENTLLTGGMKAATYGMQSAYYATKK